MNCTTSLGVQSSIRQIFSNVDSVIFRFFFRVSSVLLSKPFLRSWYCVTCLRRIVSHRGVKSINAVTTFACKKSFFTFHYTGWVCKWILWRYPQCGIISKLESLQILKLQPIRKPPKQRRRLKPRTYWKSCWPAAWVQTRFSQNWNNLFKIQNRVGVVTKSHPRGFIIEWLFCIK